MPKHGNFSSGNPFPEILFYRVGERNRIPSLIVSARRNLCRADQTIFELYSDYISNAEAMNSWMSDMQQYAVLMKNNYEQRFDFVI